MPTQQSSSPSTTDVEVSRSPGLGLTAPNAGLERGRPPNARPEARPRAATVRSWANQWTLRKWSRLLREALHLQYRSTLHYTIAAGSVGGLAYVGLVERFWQYAQAELADTRRLVEKIVALGGAPMTDAAPLGHATDAIEAVRGIVESEREIIAKLQEVIPKAGNEPRSEALEHFVEHLMSRKQEQVDQLLRAPGDTE